MTRLDWLRWSRRTESFVGDRDPAERVGPVWELNAGSHTAADHITVARQAPAQLPGHRPGTRPPTTTPGPPLPATPLRACAP
jgi:hypothetical protein